MKEESGLANAVIGLCVLGCMVAGIISIYSGIVGLENQGDLTGAGICLAAAGLCFGLVLIAILRR